jgi:ABC-type lipoprotein release transport system permease subunit
VPPIDRWTYALVAFVLLAVSVAAAWFPARRASKLDPLQALRGP